VPRLFLFLLVLKAFFSVSAFCGDVYYAGFLGNSRNAVDLSLYETMKMAAAEINSGGNDYTIEPVFFDEEDERTPELIMTKANLAAIIACFSEKHAEIIKNSGEIPLITVSKNFAGFNAAAPGRSFRICPSESQLAESLSRFSYAVIGKNKAAIIYSEGSDDYLKAAEGFAANCRANRVWADYFKSVPGDRTDFTNILLRLRDLKVQSIYFAGSMEQAAELARKSQEMNVGAVILTMDNVNTKAFIKKAKFGADMTCFSSMAPPALSGFKKFQPFLKKYRKEAAGREDIHMPFVYDAVKVLASGLTSGARKPAEITAYLKSATHDVTTGTFTFNNTGNRSAASSFFYIIARGEILHRKLQENETKKYMEAK